jgi:hypothetical protein
MLFSQKLSFIYSNRASAEAASMLNDQLKLNPGDSKTKNTLMSALKSINSGGSENLRTLTYLNQDAVSKDIADQAKLAIAKCYFFDGNNNAARNTANEIIEGVGVDDTTVFNAKMVITSIDAKMH